VALSAAPAAGGALRRDGPRAAGGGVPRRQRHDSHKEAALALADTASDAARAIGAANTLPFEPDGAIAADNTDAPGLLAALPERWSPAGARRWCSAPAVPRGPPSGHWSAPERADVAVWNRTAERARALADAFGARAVEQPPPAEIVVNCTSVGLVDTAATFKGASAPGR
jgi:shikimate dehydrogenase